MTLPKIDNPVLDYSLTFPVPNYEYYNLPEYIVTGLKKYYELGQMPEGLVYAIVTNDLFAIVALIDQESFDVVKRACLCVFNEFMPGSFGNQAIAKNHMVQTQRKLRA